MNAQYLTPDRYFQFLENVLDARRRLEIEEAANRQEVIIRIAEGDLSPNILFDLDWYSRTYGTDKKMAIRDYLINFDTRNPSPYFSSVYYHAKYGNEIKNGLTPLEHYWKIGFSEGKNSSPFVWEQWYKETYALSNATRALEHFILEGSSLSYNPSLYFDTEKVSRSLDIPCQLALYYYMADPERWLVPSNDAFDPELFVAGANCDDSMPAIFHYELNKPYWRLPLHRKFHGDIYLSRNPDVLGSEFSPLEHFLRCGQYESRIACLQQAVDQLPYHDREYNRYLSQVTHQPNVGLADRLPYRPLISILVPLYKTPLGYLRELIQSVISQQYDNWELCFSAANNLPQETLDYLAAFSQPNFKIFYCENAPGISENTNNCLRIAAGEFIALLDHDDFLNDAALYEYVKILNSEAVDLFYCDKDLVTDVGGLRKSPLFKPAYSPEIMLSANYMTHFNLIRTSLVKEIGGWDPETDGAQDWDIFLRCMAAGAHVKHVPKTLYHWREAPTSVSGGIEAKPYAKRGQLRAIQKYLDATAWCGAKAQPDELGQFFIEWPEGISDVEIVCYNTESGVFPSFMRGRGITVTAIPGPLLVDEVARIVSDTASKYVVFYDATLVTDDTLLSQIVGPLTNPDIAAVTGIVLRQDRQTIAEAGYVWVDQVLKPLFAGQSDRTFGWFGGSAWFRNVNFSSFRILALRVTPESREAIQRYSAIFPSSLTGLSRALSTTGRIMVNPYCRAVGDIAVVPEAAALVGFEDEMFTPHLSIDAVGQFQFRALQSKPQAIQAYSAEAAYWAERFAVANVNTLGGKPKGKVGKRALFLLPCFNSPFYGGIFTILSYAEHLAKGGFDIDFYFDERIDYAQMRTLISRIIGQHSFGVLCNTNIDRGLLTQRSYKIAFASLWTTAYRLAELSNVQKKFYFVQDFEPAFYCGGTISALAEATYRLDFIGLCNSEGVYRRFVEAGGRGVYFVPPIDRVRYTDEDRPSVNSDIVRVFAYARPHNPRNCFEVLVPALKKIKSKFQDKVQILTAGADWAPIEYGLEDVVEHMGMLSLPECAALYKTVDIGISFMASPHPSYPPLEMMASGVAVCANFNAANLWLYEPGENSILFEANVQSVVDAISGLIISDTRRHAIASQAVASIRRKLPSWAEVFAELDRVVLAA